MEKIKNASQLTKVKQLTDTLSRYISDNKYTSGQPLPSINFLSNEFGVSRDTVFKALNALKADKIIDSVPAKGYYVAQPTVRIFLLLDTYSLFKYDFYNELSRNLPSNYAVDLFFHQYDEERFNKIVNESIGRYNYYLVMNLDNDKYCEVLDKIDSRRLMLIDFGAFPKEKFAYVCQCFDTALYECMTQGLNLFSKYKKIVLVYPPHSEHPASSIAYFKKFCDDFGFKCAVKKSLNDATIEPQTAYLIVNHLHLVDMLKSCRKHSYKPGKDVGIVVFNDEPMFEILENGITVISTNFKMMGRIASEFVKNQKKIQTYVPTQLIVRSTL